jgi:hypothetical protein
MSECLMAHPPKKRPYEAWIGTNNYCMIVLKRIAKHTLNSSFFTKLAFLFRDRVFLLFLEAFAQLRRRGGPTDVCSLSNDICVGLLSLSLLLLLC